MISELAHVGRFILWALLAFLLVQLSVVVFLLGVSRRRQQRVPRDFITPDTLVLERKDVVGNDLRVYVEGQSLFADMLTSIAAARHRVFFETFIWKDDAVGRAFMDALATKARAGVAVHVIYDTLANLVVPRSFFRFDESIHVLPFRAWRRPSDMLVPTRWGRDHRKLLIVDDAVGFVGGFNIGQAYRDHWRDTHLRIIGPATHDLAFAFVDFWNARSSPNQPALPQPRRPWAPRVRVHRNDPGRLLFPIRAVYIEAIEHAQRRILMTHAYFLPDPAVTAALLRAARRGVDVRILVPWQSNHIIADWLSRHLYERFLGGGVRLFLYEGAMIHAKTTTIDGEWTTIGTANMDRLSLAGNHEVNVEIFDRGMAKLMEDVFAADLVNARELGMSAWRRRPWHEKASEFILAPLWPLF